MALSEQTLHNLLKRNLHNDATLVSTDFGDYLNLAQERIVQDSPSTLGTKFAALVLDTDVRVSTLASDFYQIKAMYCSTQSRYIDPVPRQEFVETVERLGSIPSGTPDGYCITHLDESSGQWDISFTHTMNAEHTFGYWYYWKPTDMALSANVWAATYPAISKLGFGQLLVDAATMIATEANDPERFAVSAAAYERGLKNYRNFDVQQPAHTPMLRPNEGGYRGSRWRLPSNYPVTYP